MDRNLHEQLAGQQAKTDVFAGDRLCTQKGVQCLFKPIPTHCSFLFCVIVQEGTTSQVIYCFVLKRIGLRLQKLGGTISKQVTNGARRKCNETY